MEAVGPRQDASTLRGGAAHYEFRGGGEPAEKRLTAINKKWRVSLASS